LNGLFIDASLRRDDTSPWIIPAQIRKILRSLAESWVNCIPVTHQLTGEIGQYLYLLSQGVKVFVIVTYALKSQDSIREGYVYLSHETFFQTRSDGYS
jgi:hypothetical protein